MNVESRIHSASNTFFGLAIVSLIYVLSFPFGTLWGFLVPTVVFVAPVLDVQHHGPLGTIVGLALVALLTTIGYAARRHWLPAYFVGIVLYAVDGLLAAIAAPAFGGLSLLYGFGFMALLIVAVHVIALVFMVSGATAMLTAQEVESLARDLDLRAALARKLAQDAPVPPPPPAADLGTRYRKDPPR